MTGEPGRVDLQRVEVTVRCARRAYKAAAAVRAGVHAHDARCAAVAWIPELAGHLDRLAGELHTARQVLEVARAHDCPDSYPLACAVDAYDHPSTNGGRMRGRQPVGRR